MNDEAQILPPVERLQVVTVEPGDSVIVYVDGIDGEQAHAVRLAAARALCVPVDRVLVFDSATWIDVVRTAEVES